jgi:hypothetical protein
MALSSPSNLAAAWRSDAQAHARRPALDPAARQAVLDDLALRVRPTTGAHERTLPVAEPFAAVLPSLTRGAVISIDGPAGVGATSLAFGLAAAATRAGEWAAAVDVDDTLNALAAQECGVILDRFVVARRIPVVQWAATVAALLDGTTCVLACVPPQLRAGDARRLVAKARERATALVALGPWPAEAAWRVRVSASQWSAFGPDAAFLHGARTLDADIEGRGLAPGRRVFALAS